MALGSNGVSMLLKSFGVNAEEITAIAEQFKVAIPQFARNIDARVSKMESELASINNKLDLLLANSGLTLPAEVSIQHARLDNQN